MPRGSAAVVRFSSLGDVLLAGHVPSILRSVDPSRRVLFVTKARFASVLRGHPDVDRFYMLEAGSDDPAAELPMGVRGRLGDLAAALRREQVTDVFDLHQNLRSTRLTGALDPVARSTRWRGTCHRSMGFGEDCSCTRAGFGRCRSRRSFERIGSPRARPRTLP